MITLLTLAAVFVSVTWLFSECSYLLDDVRGVPFMRWPAQLQRYMTTFTLRFSSLAAFWPGALVAIVIGSVEGYFWRSRQRWRGFHRTLFQCALPLAILGLTFTLLYIVGEDPTRHYIDFAIVSLTPIAFTLIAGYHPATAR